MAWRIADSMERLEADDCSHNLLRKRMRKQKVGIGTP